MPSMQRADPPTAVVARLGAIAATLPETYEEDAWTGVRWRVRTHTFLHVVQLVPGGSPAFEAAFGFAGPATVITFRAPEEEVAYFAEHGPPYYRLDWSPTAVGQRIDADTDWDEVAETVTDSYCTRAPRFLVARLRGT